ncbi:uncharacterized protein V6R79_000029 [Siganus canaliculatus]
MSVHVGVVLTLALLRDTSPPLRFAIVCGARSGQKSRQLRGRCRSKKKKERSKTERSELEGRLCSMVFFFSVSFLSTVRLSAPGLTDDTHAADETLDGTSYMW